METRIAHHTERASASSLPDACHHGRRTIAMHCKRANSIVIPADVKRSNFCTVSFVFCPPLLKCNCLMEHGRHQVEIDWRSASIRYTPSTEINSRYAIVRLQNQTRKEGPGHSDRKTGALTQSRYHVKVNHLETWTSMEGRDRGEPWTALPRGWNLTCRRSQDYWVPLNFTRELRTTVLGMIGVRDLRAIVDKYDPQR